MPLLALAVGEPAERERVGAGEEADAVFERQPLARVELRGDVVRVPRLATLLSTAVTPLTF